jgi:hypothetical protein
MDAQHVQYFAASSSTSTLTYSIAAACSYERQVTASCIGRCRHLAATHITMFIHHDSITAKPELHQSTKASEFIMPIMAHLLV